MSRYNPKNVMEAMTYQLEDDIKVLRSLAILGDKNKFNKAVTITKEHLELCKT